ncbi:MAG: hypothetical protein AAGE80_12045 [Pseudomonadota bacterium]
MEEIECLVGNMSEIFEEMLTGGHPNSLGRTVEVVGLVLADPSRIEELFSCYRSRDPVVRLRTSNAMKRVEKENRAVLVPLVDRFIAEIGELDQASAQWTLAQLFLRLGAEMSDAQRGAATRIMKRNLARHDDWIVLKSTMETLSAWATRDDGLKDWVEPHLRRLSVDPRKTVSGRARKELRRLGFA